MTIQHLHVPDDELAAFCARWKVTELALFGSALRDDFGPESDVDLLVTFAPDARWSLFDLFAMERELEAMTGRPVDLMTKRSIEESHNWIRRKAILSTAQPVFTTNAS